MKNIIISLFLCTSVLLGDYINDNNGTVYDTSTKNMWQDDVNMSTAVNWVEANQYCEDLNLSTFTDWNLPNVNQLFLLVDTSVSDPAIDDAFSVKTSNTYWSSTTNMRIATEAISVDFSDGSIEYDDKATNNYVRCVRDW